MTPYTQLVCTGSEFHLRSAMYQNKGDGIRRIFVVERKLPRDVFTTDGGIMVDKVDKIAHKMITKTNSYIMYSTTIQKRKYFPGYETTVFDEVTIIGDRIQDMLMQILSVYNRDNCPNAEVLKEYV